MKQNMEAVSRMNGPAKHINTYDESNSIINPVPMVGSGVLKNINYKTYKNTFRPHSTAIRVPPKINYDDDEESRRFYAALAEGRKKGFLYKYPPRTRPQYAMIQCRWTIPPVGQSVDSCRYHHRCYYGHEEDRYFDDPWRVQRFVGGVNVDFWKTKEGQDIHQRLVELQKIGVEFAHIPMNGKRDGGLVSSPLIGTGGRIRHPSARDVDNKPLGSNNACYRLSRYEPSHTSPKAGPETSRPVLLTASECDSKPAQVWLQAERSHQDLTLEQLQGPKTKQRYGGEQELLDGKEQFIKKQKLRHPQLIRIYEEKLEVQDLTHKVDDTPAPNGPPKSRIESYKMNRCQVELAEKLRSIQQILYPRVTRNDRLNASSHLRAISVDSYLNFHKQPAGPRYGARTGAIEGPQGHNIQQDNAGPWGRNLVTSGCEGLAVGEWFHANDLQNQTALSPAGPATLMQPPPVEGMK